MATLGTANLPSEDEEDEDFVPDEVDSDDEARKAAAKSKQGKNKRRRGCAAAAASEEDESDKDENEASDILEDGMSERQREEKKAKLDELWNRMNQSHGLGGGNSATTGKLAPISNLSKQPTKSMTGDQSLLQQLGLGVKGRSTGDSEQNPQKDKKAVAAAALAAAKAAASAASAQQYGMVTVSESRRFAGQTITINKEVSLGSKEALKLKQEGGNGASERDAQKKAGLDAVLASLSQAKKVTVLDKSRSDWKDFKKADNSIEEELELHKKSGSTYLEKQAFLSRAQLAEYEKERDKRLASDVRNRGRL